MGGAVSSGQDNDELVDNLLESGYIRSRKVEQVFRGVDRADYVLSSHRESAYRDLAWKHGNIHLSAPCVYSEVMESLSLEPGLSFLNLGSGTGYLSTMAGLILKQYGTNHGIELHEECVKYSYDRLEEFKQKSLALDEFDFCEPLFIQGNCLNISPGRQYDRVYCGAACPETHEAFIKQFVRVGGILVMPYKDHLLRLERVDENNWTTKTMLPVSFATLVIPTASEQIVIQLPEGKPLSLQEICRGRIRRRLRKNIWIEHPELETKKPVLPGSQQRTPPQRTLRRFVIPIFEESDEGMSNDAEEFVGAARLLLNVDAHPEAITTTLQLVRAAIQPNRSENHENWHVEDRNSDDSNRYDVESVDLDLDNNFGRLDPLELGQHIDGDEVRIAESSSESTCEKSEGQSHERNNDNVDLSHNKSSGEGYSNISESDSEAEQDCVPMQRIKVAKREKTDSGIVEDMNAVNEDGSSSSNTNHSDSETADAMDVDLSDLTTSKSFHEIYNSDSASSNSTPSEDVTIAHYVDSNAFGTYMKEKIHQLPLPLSLKLYINYNRILLVVPTGSCVEEQEKHFAGRIAIINLLSKE